LDLATKVQIIVAVASGATALATVYLAYVTSRLARSTKEMAEANRQMVEANRELVATNRATLEEIRHEREERARPRVIVYVDYDRLPMLYLVVSNVGGSAASEVSFKFTPHLVRPSIEHYGEGWIRPGEGEVDLTEELNMFSRARRYGLELLPAGAKIALWWGHAEDVARQFRDKGVGAQRVEVEVFYSSLTNEEYPRPDKRYRGDFILDPVDVWRANKTAVSLGPPSLGWIVDPIVKAAEKITRAIDATGHVKIKTTADLERERAARRQEFQGLRRSPDDAPKEDESRREDPQ
jgi:hypothetical protein